jgi:hypothetical protein
VSDARFQVRDGLTHEPDLLGGELAVHLRVIGGGTNRGTDCRQLSLVAMRAVHPAAAVHDDQAEQDQRSDQPADQLHV